MTNTTAPFGRLLTAMVTPMTPDGAVDYDGAARLATHLVDDMRNEGLVISGTTGEAPTTTDEEKSRLIKAVLEAVGDRAKVVAGVGTNITAHTVELARQAERAGAHGLLAVTPYYSKPAQDALIAHFTTVADSTQLPMLIYDIPGRTAVALATETLVTLSSHPRIVGVKDAKGDLAATSQVLSRTGLAYYSGDDPMNLPLWSIGGVGCISVTGHVVGDRIFEMLEAFTDGRNAQAAKLHLSMLPVNVGLFRNQAAVMTKAAHGPARPAGRRRARPAAPRQRCRAAQSCTTTSPRAASTSRLRRTVELPAPRTDPAGSPRPQRPAGHRARRTRRDRPEHDRLRVPRPAADRRLRRAVPRTGPAGRGPDPARLRATSRTGSDQVEALVLTHAHEDHIGAVPYLLRNRGDVLLVGSKLTLALVKSKLTEHRLTPETEEVQEGTTRTFGPFELEFFAVNHSIPDALAVAIKTPAGVVLHTGDFKMDQLPLDGRLTDLAGFARLGGEGVDLLLSDSTNAEVPGIVRSERDIAPVLDEVFANAAQRIIVACFASHVHRVQQVLDTAVEAPAEGRVRRPLAWSATWASPATSATCTCPAGCSSTCARPRRCRLATWC